MRTAPLRVSAEYEFHVWEPGCSHLSKFTHTCRLIALGRVSGVMRMRGWRLARYCLPSYTDTLDNRTAAVLKTGQHKGHASCGLITETGG